MLLLLLLLRSGDGIMVPVRNLRRMERSGCWMQDHLPVCHLPRWYRRMFSSWTRRLLFAAVRMSSTLHLRFDTLWTILLGRHKPQAERRRRRRSRILERISTEQWPHVERICTGHIHLDLRRWVYTQFRNKQRMALWSFRHRNSAYFS
uniref:Putative secreted protein n=1 Tax=Anopheles darlingi TaxID=43151 RepID=A0A2M4DRR2_ANODA